MANPQDIVKWLTRLGRRARLIRYDERPVPKVIDFGVAKAISQTLTQKTIFTEHGHMVHIVRKVLVRVSAKLDWLILKLH